MELIIPSSPPTEVWHNPRSFRSRKTRGRIYAPSKLHEDCLVLMTLDEEVEAICAGERTFDLPKPFGFHKPVYETTGTSGSKTLIDVITNATLDDRIGKGLCEMLAERSEAAGVDWSPVYENDLRAEPRHANLQNVLVSRSVTIPPGDRIRMLQFLEEAQGSTLVDCAKLASPQVEGVSVVMALVFEGLVAFDLERPMVPETRFWRTEFSYEVGRDAAA